MNFFVIMLSLLIGVTSLTSSIIGLKFYGKLSADEQKANEESKRYLWGMLISSIIMTLITILVTIKSA
jgi:Na+-driven multidrug efflux pump